MNRSERAAMGKLFQHHGPFLRLGKAGWTESFAAEVARHLKDRPYLKLRIGESARAVEVEPYLEDLPEVGQWLRRGHTILLVRSGRKPEWVVRQFPPG